MLLHIEFKSHAFETPEAINARVEYHARTFDQEFRIDIEAIDKQVTDKTRLLSLTCPHNPRCVMFSRHELDQLIDIAERKGCWLLLDENTISRGCGNATLL